MKIYLQNLEKTQVAVFDNENQRGEGFANWIKLTQEEITQYLLKEAKNKKLADLSKFYDSKECWTYTLFSNLTKTYASLTGDTYFFGRCIPASLGKEMEILDDNNIEIMYFLDKTKGENLNFKINNSNARTIKKKKIELENKINLANNIEIIDSIDIKTELLNSVERNIDLDKFN
jgi:hypothetical protein